MDSPYAAQGRFLICSLRAHLLWRADLHVIADFFLEQLEESVPFRMTAFHRLTDVLSGAHRFGNHGRLSSSANSASADLTSADFISADFTAADSV